MTQPEPDRCAVDEGQETLGSLVVADGDTQGVLQVVEEPFSINGGFVDIHDLAGTIGIWIQCEVCAPLHQLIGSRIAECLLVVGGCAFK